VLVKYLEASLMALLYFLHVYDIVALLPVAITANAAITLRLLFFRHI